MQILEGMKVIQITQSIAGSRCTQLLADMGVEVVKVEPPRGDTLRMIFKMTPGAERNYSVFNRNKYGIAVNMSNPQGREVILKLATISDIFIHNLIPGSIEKLGLGYEEIRSLKRDIIYTAMGTIRMPAPGLGEHNRFILEQWLGYTPDEVQKLYKQGTIL
jgi:crotonobetainyl-CoA:carnitine CoA-transferase CaiB-like acyl-CoA transferase